MKVLLIRHGKTQGNIEKRYIGQKTDEPILKDEVTRTGQLGQKLASHLPKDYLLFCSPMIRCKQTAELLFNKKDYAVCQDFTEIDFGTFEGKTYQELLADTTTKDDYQAWIDSEGQLPFPNGESRQAFENRSFTQFCQIINEAQPASFIAIVCHGGTIMSILNRLTGKNYYDFMTDNLDGYCLEIDLSEGEINALSYCRLDDWISA